jgi:formylglycine-generating enzyme
MRRSIHFLLMLLLAASMAFTACGGGGDDGGSSGGDGGDDGVAVVDIAVIPGVTLPAYGETPVTTITETAQYTGTVSWVPVDDPFEMLTLYTANINLTAKTGYTFSGVTENFFTVAGATSVTNSAGTGMVTAVFPEITAATYTADGVSFIMAYVPGGLTFPTGVNDDGNASVTNAYFIGETEVTYELWQKVYDWAVNGTGGATGEGEYTFANAGAMGDGSGDTNQHPVTTVNWRDSMVWCNALTEWYNAQKGTSYECVYTYSSAIIRDAQDSNSTACDNAAAGSTAKGFRLLTSDEYELAARYRDGTNWTYGDHASGDDSGACYDDGDILGGLETSTVFGDYAVYNGNSGSSTAAVKSKTANALGLYDMSGNVWEWCFDPSGSGRVLRGGSWNYTAGSLHVGYWGNDNPGIEGISIGFRFARTQ